MIYYYYYYRNDESEFAVLPQKFDSSPEWWSDRIGDRLWYGFDWERIRAEKNPPQWRSDRIGDLTGRRVYCICLRSQGDPPEYYQIFCSLRFTYSFSIDVMNVVVGI